MTTKKTLVITLDDFIFEHYKIKQNIWKNIAKEHRLSLNDTFLMGHYDAHLEKREKLEREYKQLTPYVGEVNARYQKVVSSTLLEPTIKAEHLAKLHQWIAAFDVYFITNHRTEQIIQLLEKANIVLDHERIYSTKQVLNAKPEADIYLKVARLRNIKPNTMTILDATLNGVQASYLANAKGLFLAQYMRPNQAIKDFAFAYFNTLADVDAYLKELL
jgi:beta-phosphoglucomutase-like phosphatase (HAD superfamily)